MLSSCLMMSFFFSGNFYFDKAKCIGCSNLLKLFFISSIDKKQAAKHGINYQQLQDAGIWILKPEFISDFLTVHPKPSALNYVLEDVQSINNIDDHSASSTPGKRKAAHSLEKKEKRHKK